jgi:trehalose-phosphatase
VLPVYLGDDLTDESAFRILADDGLGILVGDHGEPTAAQYHLENVAEVKKFLHHVLHSA